MRELSAAEVARRQPIFITSLVQMPGKPPTPGITASVGRPASTGAGAAPGADGDAQAETFCSKVADLQHHRQISRGKAVIAAATERPDLHAAHVERVNAAARAENHNWSFITGEPADFYEAINKCLGEGFDARAAVAEAARRYPALYRQRQEKLTKLSEGHFFQD